VIDKIYYFILVPMVYFAFAVFFIGIIFRIIKVLIAPKQPSTLQIFPEKKPSWLYTLGDAFFLPTVRKHKPALWVILILYHLAFLLLLIGHIELIGNFKIFQIIPHEIFLGKGVVGLILTISLVYFLFRRFKSPYREISVPEDFFLLILLIFTVIFGGHMNWAFHWSEFGFDLSVDEFREYLSSIFTLKPVIPEMITDSPHCIILVLHIFFANLLLIFFPFSKIMHSFFTIPLNKIRRG